jgi:AcrR family transcriptional regulator
MEREKKDCILRAACKAFARFGFKKASVEEIAKEAGVAKGTVYLACESKEDLFYQVLNQEVRAWVGETSRLIDPRVAADELMKTIALAAVGHWQQRPLVRDLFFGVYNGMIPGWAVRFDELRALGQANLIEILKLGIKQGLFRKNLDLEQVAELLQDLQIATYLFHSSGRGHEERLARRAAAGFDLILNGLFAPNVKQVNA